MVILVSGVSGSGKSTVGAELARQLGWTFLDADDDHPPANVAKMRSGIPLTDDDRAPWLEAVRARIQRCVQRRRNVVVACSALKRSYREYLEHVPDRTVVVQLHAPEPVTRSRLITRAPHFMPPGLLPSQYELLESSESDLIVDATVPVQEVVATIRRELGV